MVKSGCARQILVGEAHPTEIMDIENIKIIGGYGKTGEKEPVTNVTFEMGSVVSIVGPTGSGKTALINDIELFANENPPSRRKVLINDLIPSEEPMGDPSRNPIAMITQHTNFLSDLSVRAFLSTHARIRQKSEKVSGLVEETIDIANQLTGEPIIVERAMTELSGGQARALMITDAVVIGNSPIILLDEIENAGIDRIRAVELLRQYKKIFIFVTHDLRITLLSDFRIVMKNGAMQKVVLTGDEEKRVAKEIIKLDDLRVDLRNQIRLGKTLNEEDVEERLRDLVQ